MALNYGRRILGDKAYDKAATEAAKEKQVHGGEKRMYGSRILGKPAAAPTEPAQTEPKPPALLSVPKLKVELTDSNFEELAQQELAAEKPRKGALELLLAHAGKMEPAPESVAQQLEAAFTQLVEG